MVYTDHTGDVIHPQHFRSSILVPLIRKRNPEGGKPDIVSAAKYVLNNRRELTPSEFNKNSSVKLRYMRTRSLFAALYRTGNLRGEIRRVLGNPTLFIGDKLDTAVSEFEWLLDRAPKPTSDEPFKAYLPLLPNARSNYHYHFRWMTWSIDSPLETEAQLLYAWLSLSFNEESRLKLYEQRLCMEVRQQISTLDLFKSIKPLSELSEPTAA